MAFSPQKFFCTIPRIDKFLVPEWGDKVDSGIGLSYRPARLRRLAGRYDYPVRPCRGLDLYVYTVERERKMNVRKKSTFLFFAACKAKLRIRDILVWIRIRIWIRGPMPLTDRCQQKTNLNKSFPSYDSLKVHLHNFSKKKSQKEVANSGNQAFFLLFLFGDRRIRIQTSD
jgi:hypothetical protein